MQRGPGLFKTSPPRLSSPGSKVSVYRSNWHFAREADARPNMPNDRSGLLAVLDRALCIRPASEDERPFVSTLLSDDSLNRPG